MCKVLFTTGTLLAGFGKGKFESVKDGDSLSEKQVLFCISFLNLF